MDYLIKGVILQPFHPNVIFEGEVKSNKSGKLSGFLADVYGAATIEGLIKESEEKMSFNKQYRGRSSIIKYDFEKEGPLWVGHYSFTGALDGSSFCELTDTDFSFNWEENLNRFEMPPQHSERWAKDLVGSMVKEGYFMEVKDTKTGEESLVPIRKRDSQN